MFTFHHSLCFPCVHYVSLLHFLRLCSFPLTLSYCTSLNLLRSHTRIPLWRIQLLVYISHVLVATTSELILLVPTHISLRFFGTLGNSGSALAVFVSSCLNLILPAHILVWIVDSYPQTHNLILPWYVWIWSDPNVTYGQNIPS